MSISLVFVFNPKDYIVWNILFEILRNGYINQAKKKQQAILLIVYFNTVDMLMVSKEATFIIVILRYMGMNRVYISSP
jgi:hypothetical protein